MTSQIVSTETQTEPRTERLGRPSIRAIVAWLVVLGFGLRWLDELGRSRTFFYDEWMFIADRWRLEISSVLESHNGHPSIFPASVFLLLFHSVGLDDYRVYRLVGLLVHAGVATAVAWYVWRRRGEVAAVSIGGAVLLLGAGWENILWPFEISFNGSTLGFIGALLALDRGTTRSDVAALLMLVIAIGSSGVGIAATAAVLVGLIVNRATRHRWWVAGGPLLLFALWYLFYGASQASLSNAPLLPRYLFDSASGAVAGIFAGDLSRGRVIFCLMLAVGLAALYKQRTLSPRVLTLIFMLLSFWILTGLTRAQLGQPAAERYVYVGTIVLILLLVETVPVWPNQRFYTAGVVVLSLSTIWAGSDSMRQGAEYLRWAGQAMGAELAVMEQYRDRTDPDYRIDPIWAPMVPMGQYLEAVDGLGSSAAFPIAAVPEMPYFARQGADRVLRELAPLVTRPVDDIGLECLPAEKLPDELRLQGGTAVVLDVAEPLDIHWWRFFELQAHEPPLRVEPGSLVAIDVPADDSSFPWTLLFVGSSESSYCTVALG